MRRWVHDFRHGNVHLFAVCVLVLLAGIGYAGFRVYNYTEHDPRFCQSCHLMQEAYDKWAKSVHSVIDCHQCHHATKLDGLRQLWLTVTKRPNEVGPHAQVPKEICEQCHRSHQRRWIQVMGTAGHQIHVYDNELKCLDCHAQSLHEFPPPNTTCAKANCHDDIAIKLGDMDKVHCTSCHNFLVHGETLKPSAGVCLTCHSDANKAKLIDFPAETNVDHSCRECHNPHKGDHDLRQRCEACHKEQTAAVVDRTDDHRDCLACHKRHVWRTKGNDTCLECHQASQLERRPEHRVTSHIMNDLQCVDCHRPHQWKQGGREACIRCHKQRNTDIHPATWRTRHGRAARRPGALCSGCHQRKMCLDCHGPTPVPHPSDWSISHGDFAARHKTACRRCHQRQAFCASCHDGSRAGAL